MNAGRLQTNITPGAISEQLAPKDIQEERVHEWDFMHNTEVPPGPPSVKNRLRIPQLITCG